MYEFELFTPLKNGLKSLGLDVYAEVSLSYTSAIDVVALKEEFKIGIELKTSNTKQLVRQAARTTKYCNYTFVATPTVPDKEYLKRLKRVGAGFILINESSINMYAKPRLVKKPKRNIIIHPAYKNNIGGIAGQSEKLTIFQQLTKDVEAFLLARPDRAIHISKLLSWIRSYCIGRVTKRKINKVIDVSPNVFLYKNYVMYLKNYQDMVPHELRDIIEEGIRREGNVIRKSKL